MFHGGLNRDGFFGEEYYSPNGGYEGDVYGSSWGPPSDEPLSKWNLTKTGIETKKAMLLRFEHNEDSIEFWLPKSCMTLPYYDHIKWNCFHIYKEAFKNALKAHKEKTLSVDEIWKSI